MTEAMLFSGAFLAMVLGVGLIVFAILGLLITFAEEDDRRITVDVWICLLVAAVLAFAFLTASAWMRLHVTR